jgi:hypothetical protein
MHYKVASGILIKTENAAKPESQASSFLRLLLEDLPLVQSSFDCGCGKLRYMKKILDRTDELTVVDSEIQLSRTQMICGRKTSIREMANRSNRMRALNVDQFASAREKYDRGFCINVLSVIPILSVRNSLLKTIHSRLKKGASCLFVVQYRNSDFARMREMPNAREWRDGFLIDSLRGYSFYALIPPSNLEAMVKRSGFAVESVRLNEGSAYLWATAT